MIELQHAYQVFDAYLDQFDREHEKIKLKIIHTKGVVDGAREIANRMGLSPEDCQLAELIALLHDIGRFEQIRLYDSFEPTMMDHAAFGVELLFGPKMMIRDFVQEDTWDEIIRSSIALHSDYALPEILDQRILLHAKLIRDADKLDNCRVKIEDGIEVMLGVGPEVVGAQQISDVIWDTCLKQKSILSQDRVTKMDYWVSYIAYFFDINFPETLAIIKEEDYVMRIINRISYTNPDTAQKMATLGKMICDFIDEAVGQASLIE